MTAHGGDRYEVSQAGMSASIGNNSIGNDGGKCDSNMQLQPNIQTQSPSNPSADKPAINGCWRPASFMINSNYRIIPPSPKPGSNDFSVHGADRKNAAAVSAAGLPSWVSPSSRSKTYFPAKSPIIGGHRTDNCMDTFSGESSSGVPDSAMDVDSNTNISAAQELRIEYDVLPYEVHRWSSHSANFLPQNILCDRPHDQASRWATNINNHRQFITLRLEHPALVRSITFGKYYKTHVCNLKEFKVFGGMTEDNMTELLYSGLRNDSESETISLRQKLHGFYIPCRYIKIQPLLAHDQKFNFSVWFVELCGTMDQRIMQNISSDFSRFKEREVIRSCLKFFRDKNYTSAFNALAAQSSVLLESPLLTEIQKALVEEGNYDFTERLLRQAEHEGVFSSCTADIPYVAAWDRFDSLSYVAPAARGGHQMCIDEEARVAYLYGGWDGANNLGDLWMLRMDTGKWVCLSTNTRNEGGPGPRSCHAMCFDSAYKCLYVMGKYVDHEYRGNTGMENDLYCYDTQSSEWLVLSENTEVLNGPKLLFNTQMVVDTVNRCIYVYGGKVVLPDANDSTIVYSGLYRFDLRQHKWTKLRPDFHMMEQEQHVRGRYFHSMLIDTQPQRLYVLSGKRDVSAPGDLIIYDIATNTFFEKMTDLATAGSANQPITQQQYLAEKQRHSPIYPAVHAQAPHLSPDSSENHSHHSHLVQDGRTIRATLDPERQEIYVLAAAQCDVNPLPSVPMLQTLMSLRAAREPDFRYSDQAYDATTYAGNRPANAYNSISAGFHPCSALLDTALESDPSRLEFVGLNSGSGAGAHDLRRGTPRRAANNDANGVRKSQRHAHQPQAENILMVVLCYHIPTETWSEVYNSSHAAAMYNASIVETAYMSDNERPGTIPPPRFAQDWAFDRKTRRHYMFGGNPKRPNDKSARFNDTWELTLTRPNSQDILRRALYLVRQRRFLDMCFGIETADLAKDGYEVMPNSSGNAIAAQLTPEDARTDEDYKASAIPSPNSSGFAGSQANPPSPIAKRSPPLATDEDGIRGCKAHGHQCQRQKMTEAPSLVSELLADSSHQSLERTSLGFKSSTSNATSRALSYLQQYIAPLINLNDPSECQSFHTLSTALFQIPPHCYSKDTRNDAGRTRSMLLQTSLRTARASVYEALLDFFPKNQKQPAVCLDEFITRMVD
ncbi:hypothetical protein EV178_005187 [Coemansia sp. RSA 1646]|nr:hypothetical protein EV178_005187 [Coemansia sp. RSA 1646]KAJ2215202.1 hypothetical protein EV179_002421 [Coemansia sp. RSA 487]